VVYRQLRLALATTCSGHGVPLARVTCFFIIAAVVVCHGHNPLRTLLAPPFLPPLTPCLASWMVTLNGASLPLLGVASLLLEAGQSSVVSLSVAY
jgi:hypothetical protein